MKDFYRAAIKIIIAFLIVMVLINDGVSVISTYVGTAQSADTIAEEMNRSYTYDRNTSLELLYAEAEEMAQEDEVRLSVWLVDENSNLTIKVNKEVQGEVDENNKLTIKVSKKVQGTWFIHYVARYVDFLKPYFTASSTKVIDFSRGK